MYEEGCGRGEGKGPLFCMITIPRISLTLTVLVATIDSQWEGMGDVGSARYEPALLPPCPTIRVLATVAKFITLRVNIHTSYSLVSPTL